jgi:hypothetical protein
MCHFILPCAIMRGVKKPKRIAYNLNWYRNAHFRLLTDIKAKFEPLYSETFKADKIEIVYDLRLKRENTDLMNWVSVVDKFFLDWLVKQEMIPDDTVVHVGAYVIRHEIDKELPDHELHAFIKIVS